MLEKHSIWFGYLKIKFQILHYMKIIIYTERSFAALQNIIYFYTFSKLFFPTAISDLNLACQFPIVKCSFRSFSLPFYDISKILTQH